MGRKKSIWLVKNKDIEKEILNYSAESIKIYEDNIKDNTKGDLNKLKEIIGNDNHFFWYRLLALKIHRSIEKI